MGNDAPEIQPQLSKRRLRRLEEIRRLFILPAYLWFAIVLFDFIFFVVEIDSFLEVRLWVEKIAFYSFPLLLIYLVFATFYSSYRILESRGYKNMATFFFFQLIAYFIINVLQIEIPKYDKTTSLLLTVLTCFVLFGIISLVQLRIKVPSEISKQSRSSVNETMGMVISAIFSIVIASMIYFRIRGGISFVTWGVFFGVTLSAMIHKADKTILGILYFLDPRGASNLYKILKLKSDVEDAQDLSEVEIEMGILGKADRRTEALRLANQLDQELSRLQFQQGEQKIRALIAKLRDSEQLPPEEQQRILADVTGVITTLRSEQKIPPMLPEVDYSSLSIGEKIAQLVGLTQAEIKEAIKESLIDEKQSYLWLPLNQTKIKRSVQEFDEEKYQGGDPILVPNSWVPFFESNQYLLERIVMILTGDDEFDLKGIKGAEKHNLSELVFSTAANEYSAVLKVGRNNSYLIHAVFDKQSRNS